MLLFVLTTYYETKGTTKICNRCSVCYNDHKRKVVVIRIKKDWLPSKSCMSIEK